MFNFFKNKFNEKPVENLDEIKERRFCKDCHYFYKKNNTELRYGKCTHPFINDKSDFLVSAQPEDAQFASVARDFNCGIEAKFFKQKEKNNKIVYYAEGSS